MTTSRPLEIGMVGLGRMGANLVRRATRDGHSAVVYDSNPDAVAELVAPNVRGAQSLADLVTSLSAPRTVWLMLPAAITDQVIDELATLLASGDTIIDGGNSYYRDDLHRAERLLAGGLHYVDVGTSGGVWGLERGFSLMIGGEEDVVARLDPLFASLAPGGDGTGTAPLETAQRGYLHCGPVGAGHFVKMVHNGIEYGMMAAIAEGLSVLRHANVGAADRRVDAETAPLRHPEYYRYDFDLAAVTEVWRHGSVISSWLLDLTAAAFADSPDLGDYAGHVADSGEGRWTIEAAIDESVPAPVLTAALYERFESRGEGEFAAKILSAMRAGFGGHHEVAPH